ncbi:MAG: hypothetical protein CME62_02675 [Halobacteriovoraceae bacterium]|nr:hypothetical protein [Halobacteriovoraceae bacterium]|tara:strand:+ start:8094 stop:8906 length:813 start_codon:yes stop_codon:yes gene_type:complete
MRKFAIFKNSYLVLFMSLILLFCAGSLHTKLEKPPITIDKQSSALNFNDNMLSLFSMGQTRLLADLFWIVTLLESDEKHYKTRDLNSWMYLRFNTILNLDPKFLKAYRFGGKYLSIIKDDIVGAKEIFERGLKHYPDDYNLIYDTAYLYAFELDEFAKASELYKKLSQYPQAPEFIATLAAKIDFAAHEDLDLTYKILLDLLNSTPEDSNLYSKIKNDLYSIKAEKDLSCLNSGKANCDRKDFLGNKYLYKDGKFQTAAPFKPYKFNKRN